MKLQHWTTYERKPAVSIDRDDGVYVTTIYGEKGADDLLKLAAILLVEHMHANGVR
jgi:hypothetical protein